VRNRLTAWAVLSILFASACGYALGHASDRDETVLTVEVSSAEHEAQEGSFSLGDTATVMAKPGSELYRFLLRQRGHKIRVTLTEAGAPDLSRLGR
jgi:hypothetical protein